MTILQMPRPPESPPTSAPASIRLSGLTKRYGDRVAVNDLSFDVEPGTVTGFAGPNGAGKTTTFRMLLGLVRASAGHADVLGGDLSRVGALIEGPAFYPALSGRRNLWLLAVLGGIAPERVGRVLDTVGLADRANDLVRSYSLGMRQRLGMAAAMLPDPAVLLLDEPTNGLDPQGIRDVRALIRQLAADGKTILISSHLLSELEHVCDRLVVIDGGSLVYSGPMADLEARQSVELVVRPEHADDLARLVTLLDRHGYAVHAGDREIRVHVSGAHAAALNLLAFRGGITIAELRAEREDLEATFFRMLWERAA
jgi:ABC-2 type transport system ATP-binding protein